ARAARTRLAALGERLAEHQFELDRLAATATARAGTLAAAAADRRRFIGDLRRQKHLDAARIASIEAEAHAAELRTTAMAAPQASPTATAADPAPQTAPAPAEVAAPTQPSAGPGTLTVSVTGYSLRGLTATGIPTAPGVVAVDPSVIPLGSRMTIPGYGVGIAADTGGAVHGNTIDVWFPTTAEALQWGRRTVTITIH
ncbi:MAG: 3D domain-containing protein, partial [Gaiellaceae bacterium]